jgi:hypothetical protein
MNLGRGGLGSGEALPLLPDSKDSASEKWMRHYIINDSRHGDFGCPYCFVGDTADESRFCPEGMALRRAALAEMKANPVPKPVKKPHHSAFNPAMERHG